MFSDSEFEGLELSLEDLQVDLLSLLQTRTGGENKGLSEKEEKIPDGDV